MCDKDEKNKGDEDMAKMLEYPTQDNSSTAKKTGWRRMAQISEQSMKENDYNITDVRKELKNIRDKY